MPAATAAAATGPSLAVDPRAALVVAEQQAKGGGPLAGRWAVAAALLVAADPGRTQEGYQRLEQLARERPSDPDVLLGLAALEEARVDTEVARIASAAAPAGSASLPQFQRQAARESRLREIEARYRAVLRGRADDHEAHLRLGRVLQQRGDREARQHLEAAASTGGGDTRSLALLFLGELHESAGQVQEAIARYRAAIAAAPSAQSARIALAQALLRTGDRNGAREAIEAGLSGPPAGLDPLLAYERPGLRLGTAMATTLGKEARQ
jgi:tetratricopeptide (TPR) repeat protein